MQQKLTQHWKSIFKSKDSIFIVRAEVCGTTKIRATEVIVDIVAKTSAQDMVKMMTGYKESLSDITVHFRITDVAGNLQWQTSNF